MKIIIEECTPTPDMAWEDGGVDRRRRKETLAQDMVLKWNPVASFDFFEPGPLMLNRQLCSVCK